MCSDGENDLRYPIYQLLLFFQCLPKPFQVFKVTETGRACIAVLFAHSHEHILRKGSSMVLSACLWVHESSRVPRTSHIATAWPVFSDWRRIPFSSFPDTPA